MHGEVTILTSISFLIYSYNVIRHTITNFLFTFSTLIHNSAIYNFNYILFSFDSKLLSPLHPFGLFRELSTLRPFHTLSRLRQLHTPTGNTYEGTLVQHKILVMGIALELWTHYIHPCSGRNSS